MNRPIFSEMRPWCMVREGPYKLVADKEPWKLTHLFDIESDPYEMTDLLNAPPHADTKRHLSQLLKEWFDRVTVS